MTNDVRPEQRLGEMLEEIAPSRAPDRLRRDFYTSMDRVQPRPRWLALIKESPMRLSSRVAVGSPTFRLASLVAITVALILALGAAVVGAASLLPSPKPTTPSPTPGPATCADLVCSTGPLADGRAGQSATRLADGSVLVIGGATESWKVFRLTAERWDPSSGHFQPAGSLAEGRQSHTATLLPDGRILVVGGYGGSGRGDVILASAEVWDPGAQTFSPTGQLGLARASQGAALLPDGRVLVIGGWSGPETKSTDTTEIWDPKTGTFSPGPSLTEPRGGVVVLTLTDGRILVVGGNERASASAEIFDPTSFSFLPTGGLPQPGDFTIALLPGDRVLAVGGPGAQSVTSSQVWDPATGIWTPSGAPLEPYTFYQTETALDDGRVLMNSGAAEIWDPDTGGFSAVGPAASGAGKQSATLLTDGRVLVVGGTDGSTAASFEAAEIWDVHGFVPPASSDGPSPMP